MKTTKLNFLENKTFLRQKYYCKTPFRSAHGFVGKLWSAGTVATLQ